MTVHTKMGLRFTVIEEHHLWGDLSNNVLPGVIRALGASGDIHQILGHRLVAFVEFEEITARAEAEVQFEGEEVPATSQSVEAAAVFHVRGKNERIETCQWEMAPEVLREPVRLISFEKPC